MWPNLAARDAGKLSLCFHPDGQVGAQQKADVFLAKKERKHGR